MSKKALLLAGTVILAVTPVAAMPLWPETQATDQGDGEGGLGSTSSLFDGEASWLHDDALKTERPQLLKVDSRRRYYDDDDDYYHYFRAPYYPYWAPPGHRKHKKKYRKRRHYYGYDGGEGGEGGEGRPIIVYPPYPYYAPPAYLPPFKLPYRTSACPPVIKPNRISRATIGTILGAAGGGLAGAQIGSGTGQLVATGVGTALGLLIGQDIGRRLDYQDQVLYVAAEHQALAGPHGCRVAWHNPSTDHAGQVYVLHEGPGDDGRYCREYQTTVIVGGRSRDAYGRACLQPDGSWEIVS